MPNNTNVVFTDSLERELLNQELDYFNDAPLQSFARWVASGFNAIVGKVATGLQTQPAELSRAQK